MHRCLQGPLVAVCGVALSAASLLAESVKPDSSVVSSLDRFSGRISADAGLVETPIHYQVLSLAPGIRAAASPPNADFLELPLKAKGGFVVYELRAGRLTTIIDGRRQERREGELWLVRPNENIIIETGNDNVVVQVIQVPGP